jgi:heat shock protein HslJ
MNKIHYALIAFAWLWTTSCASRAGLTAASLEKTWLLVSIGENPVLEYSQPKITFSSNNQWYGDSSCNSFGGTYTLKRQYLSLVVERSTMKACVEELMRQESQVIDALSKTEKAVIAYDKLILKDDDGDKLLIWMQQHEP